MSDDNQNDTDNKEDDKYGHYGVVLIEITSGNPAVARVDTEKKKKGEDAGNEEKIAGEAQ